MQDVEPIINRLNRARAELQAALNTVPGELWRKAPPRGGWSVAEVIAHLTMVEDAITSRASSLLRANPRPVPHWRRIHLPVILAEWRGVRAKTPIPLDHSLVRDRTEMLAALTALRQRTLTLLRANRERDLQPYRWPHFFFGSLHFYDWFRLVAHHELRHTKQILEIVDSLKS